MSSYVNDLLKLNSNVHTTQTRYKYGYVNLISPTFNCQFEGDNNVIAVSP